VEIGRGSRDKSIMDDDDEISVRMIRPFDPKERGITVIVPEELWDYENLGEAIKCAVKLLASQMPNDLDS
jgi:hypothetical protein